MSTSSAAPEPGRALAPDLARGVMLLLIALAHAHMYLSGHPTGFRAYATDGSPLDLLVTGLQVTFVDGRAMPMFAALFGYGLTQIAGKQTGDWPHTRSLLRRRSGWLLAFGACHALLLFFGDILAAYGLAGLLLTSTLRWRDRSLVLLATGWLLVHATAITLTGLQIATFGGPSGLVSATDPITALTDRLTQWSTLTPFLLIELIVPFLIGTWAARRHLMTKPHHHFKTLRTTAFAGISTAALGGLPLALLDAQIWTDAPATLSIPAYTLHGLTGLTGGIGYAALMGVIAARTTTQGPVLTALAACGQRSLTCYLLQSVVFVAVFAPYAGGLGAELGTAAASGIAICTWLTTVLLANALRRNNHPGPAEALLRRLTYRTNRKEILSVQQKLSKLRSSRRTETTMSFQAYLDGAEKKTGKTPAELLTEAAGRGYDASTKAGVVLEWLKTDYDLGRGHGMALYHVLKNGPQISEKHVGTNGSHRDESATLRLDGIANR